MRHLSFEEVQLPTDSATMETVGGWLARGDGIAVYENVDLGHPDCGHRQFLSYGSPAAQIEDDTPPNRLPDIGVHINWRYHLVGVYRPDAENEHRIHFGTLHPDGTVTEERYIKQSDIQICPYVIMMPEHYREDGSCRCNDPDHREMAEWGYQWDSEQERWVGDGC